MADHYTKHAVKALDALEAVQATVEHLQGLRHDKVVAGKPVSSTAITEAYEDIRNGLKRAQVHALLSVSEAIGGLSRRDEAVALLNAADSIKASDGGAVEIAGVRMTAMRYAGACTKCGLQWSTAEPIDQCPVCDQPAPDEQGATSLRVHHG